MSLSARAPRATTQEGEVDRKSDPRRRQTDRQRHRREIASTLVRAGKLRSYALGFVCLKTKYLPPTAEVMLIFQGISCTPRTGPGSGCGSRTSRTSSPAV